MASGDGRSELAKYFADSGDSTEFDTLFDSPGAGGPGPTASQPIPVPRVPGAPTAVVRFEEPAEDVPSHVEEAPESPSTPMSPGRGLLVPGSPLGQTAVMKSCVGDMSALAEADEAQEAGIAISQTLSVNLEEEEEQEVTGENEPISFLARAKEPSPIPIGEGKEITIEEASEMASDPALAKKRESEPRVFKFEDVSDEASVFDEIVTQAVQELKLDEPESPEYSSEIIDTSVYSRCRDAWIPSAATREALVMMATAPRGTYVPNKALLTMPGVRYEGSLINPLRRAVAEHLSDEDQTLIDQNCPNVDSVTQDDRGLVSLIERGCYNAAVALTSRLLNMYGQGSGKVGQPSRHTTHSLQLWFIRLMCLTKLRLYNEALRELEAFGDLDNPDLYLEWSPDLNGGRRGSMVPFGFRLLAAAIMSNAGKEREAIERMYTTEIKVEKIISNLEKGLREDGSDIEMKPGERQYSLGLWKSRRCEVLRNVVNLCVASKDYKLAVRNLRKWSLVESDPDQRALMESLYGRVFLLMGMIDRAQAHFTRAWQATTNPTAKVAEKRKAYFLMDSALLAVAQNSHEEAYKFFEQLHSLFPTNIMVRNNMAICRVYQGRVKEAIVILEAAVRERPDAALNEGLVFNLCSMYELVNTPQAAAEQRKEILRKVVQHKGDSFPLAALQLPA